MCYMKSINDWWWPDTDKLSHVAAYNSMLRDLWDTLSLVKNKDTCVQAGGAVGIWPQKLSSVFNYVYTFEADPEQFKCLQENISAKNVYKYNCALGEDYGFVSPVHDDKRCNASHVSKRLGKEIIECYPLDAFTFDTVDFICFDLEGYEYFAIQGAEETISRHSPVIQVEDKHADRFELERGDVDKLMAKLGYKLAKQNKYDKVFVRQ